MVFEFKSIEEFKAKVESRDLTLSMEIFKQIKKAFYSKVKRKKATAFVAKVGKNDVIEFILERDKWPISLNTCMNIFAENDMFEECIEIQKILKEL